MDSGQTPPEGFWESYVEAWKGAMKPYVPYPAVTADKLACLNWQHLLYVSFVALEAACQGELVPSSESTPGTLTCKEGDLSLEASSAGQATWIATFGVENSALGCPAVSDAFATLQVEALKYMMASGDRKLLGLLEGGVEDWLDEKLAPDWNIYLELAEMGELSEESIRLLEKIQRRLSVFRRKTIRSHLSNSKPSAGPLNHSAKASYIRNQTRRRRLASEGSGQTTYSILKQTQHPTSQPALPAAVTTVEDTAPTHVEDGTGC